MKAEAFRKLTNELKKLTPHRQQLLSDRLRTGGQVRVVRNLVESRVFEVEACVHDSQVLDAVLRAPEVGGECVWADSAYRSEGQEQRLDACAHHSLIHERAYRNKPLSEAADAINTEKSRIRARIEHVFGYQENSMGGIFLRSVGMARAAVGIGMMNLVYNLCRVETLIRLRVFDFDRIGASSAPQRA